MHMATYRSRTNGLGAAWSQESGECCRYGEGENQEEWGRVGKLASGNKISLSVAIRAIVFNSLG